MVFFFVFIGYCNEVCWFWNGFDYIFVNGEGKDGDVRLDVFLGMIWWVDVLVGSDEEDVLVENGGWEVYFVVFDEDEDFIVY